MKNIFCFLLVLISVYQLNAQKAYQPEFGNGDYKAVVDKADKALLVNPTDSIAHYVLGLSYTQLKEHDKAVENLLKAKNNGLNFFLVQLALAKNYAKLDKIDESIQELETASKAPGLRLAMIEVPEFESLQSNDTFLKIKKKIYSSTYPCKADSNYRRFDFWVGQWDVYTQGGKGPKIAESSITLTNGDCGILENYRPIGRAGGHSISYFDSADKKWKQNWVAGGSVSHYVEPENPSDGNMQIVAESLNPQGVKVLLRMTYFKNTDDNSVRQLMDRSTDEGETWTVVYDGLYKTRSTTIIETKSED